MRISSREPFSGPHGTPGCCKHVACFALKPQMSRTIAFVVPLVHRRATGLATTEASASAFTQSSSHALSRRAVGRHRHRELCDGGASKALVNFLAYARLLLGESRRDRALPLVLAFSVIVHVALWSAGGEHAISRRVASLSLRRTRLRQTVHASPGRTLVRCPMGVREPRRLRGGAPPGV